MANKHIKKKKGLRYKSTSIRMTKIKKAENIKCWQRRGVTVILVHCWWQSVTTLKKDLLVCVFFFFLQKTKHKSIL